MVPAQPGTGTRARLREIAQEYAQAQLAWSESFLRHKMATPPNGQQVVTDGQARAMADQDVDLTGARVRYEVALVEAQTTCR
jgi:hypothetical protein